jgi:hypothetical protein
MEHFMPAADILLPALALMGWTQLVLLMIPYRRFLALRAQRVRTADFRLGESQQVPEDVSLPNRNYMNLLELPVLFYALSLMFYVTQKADSLALGLAWGYVGCRMLHSVIHLWRNHVMFRMSAFAASNVFLLALWLLMLNRLL